MADTLRYALIMLAAGIGIPVLAALNAQLGARIGSPAAAASVLFVVACTASVLVAAATGGLGKLALIPAQPRHLLLAGLLVAFYVLSITWVAPRFGVGNAIFFVLLGQLVSATAIDQFGLFGAAVKPLGLTRGAGLGLMAMGVFLCQKA
ncbi:DMT family transporter [Albidovulum sp.]|uniref:DMT family transporter n=1 Tax=Albidovulum sp. TaxID=1872424 RepID=UPI001E160D5E|nr:DMT family transporter [Paracoccaceae bacterium]MCC0047443.1 DMT family transporter [Defluviimonas sp.]HPE25347.1 DMT family transporter [Albidovulum sp.]MCB2120753.1 DMT family transporter [Paracoccaceae bacterium]MCB2122361.1 DMT family transporter [Paracoccaceae bacterium]